MTHELKILPKYFKAVKEGRKTFEVRFDDRGFNVGDTLVLKEWVGDYTGKSVKVLVTYILTDEEYVRPNYCILGIKLLNSSEPNTAEYEGRRKALDEVYVQYINRDNDDSFYEWLTDNLLEEKQA